MRRALANLPFAVLLAGAGALAMGIPAAHGLATGDLAAARVFLSHAALILTFCVLIGLATSAGRTRPQSVRAHLAALLASLAGLPMVLALPMAALVPDTRFVNLYVEMVAALTTTGGSVLDDPGRFSPSLHLWRASVAWLGGFLFWLAAFGILAPLDLGGFEIFASRRGGHVTDPGPTVRTLPTRALLARIAQRLGPVYLGLSGLLALGLLIAGERPLAATIHAMSTIATSGISLPQGFAGAQAGIGGELLVFVFLFLAVSHVTYSGGAGALRPRVLLRDREIQVALICLAVLPALLMLRHWAGALDLDDQDDLVTALRAFWGSLFTTLSFLTTTGFVSAEWQAARDWSGLETPGLFLTGLALMGGGIATTSGGMKLLRVHALYKHAVREMELLVHPDSVAGSGPKARRIRREGARIAWVFFMLYLLSVVVVMAALGLAGVRFADAMTLAIAALSTTGPLAAVSGISLAALDDGAKLVLAAAMVLGRLETLAILGLLRPSTWR